MEPPLEEQLEELAERLIPFGLFMTDSIKRRLLRFSTELLRWNRRYGLLSRRDAVNVVRKHVASSLGVLLLTSSTAAHDERWVDVGSGAGLPGLVLKSWYPELDIVLIEGSRRRCVFMQSAAGEIGLSPMKILPVRVETLVARGEMIGSFDVLLARAVADIRATLVNFGPLVRKGGRILTFKGPGWREDVEKAASGGLCAGGPYHLGATVAIPWTPGRILEIHKISG